MKTKNYLKILHVDHDVITPIYRQLADGILDGIDKGQIVKNDILPSLHDLCVAFNISKNTVEKAYFTLKQIGVVGSVKGKGFYVKATLLQSQVS
ncbi:MAG: winged helix-turn-helix domain-containing protein [Bacteroidota bacterium]